MPQKRWAQKEVEVRKEIKRKARLGAAMLDGGSLNGNSADDYRN